MDQAFRLQPLLDLARMQTDVAARELGALTTQGMDAQRKLELLLQYRNTCQQQFQEAMRRGVHNTEWRNYQEFMLKLETAIAQQHRVVAGSRERVEEGRRRFSAQQRKLDSYAVLAKRHKGAQALHAARREQKDSDEHAARSGRRRQLHPDNE